MVKKKTLSDVLLDIYNFKYRFFPKEYFSSKVQTRKAQSVEEIVGSMYIKKCIELNKVLKNKKVEFMKNFDERISFSRKLLRGGGN